MLIIIFTETNSKITNLRKTTILFVLFSVIFLRIFWTFPKQHSNVRFSSWENKINFSSMISKRVSIFKRWINSFKTIESESRYHFTRRPYSFQYLNWKAKQIELLIWDKFHSFSAFNEKPTNWIFFWLHFPIKNLSHIETLNFKLFQTNKLLLKDLFIIHNFWDILEGFFNWFSLLKHPLKFQELNPLNKCLFSFRQSCIKLCKLRRVLN